MKYSEVNAPLMCIMRNSKCYKNTGPMIPKGILWHSTGKNNPFISRYVQPLVTDDNYEEIIDILGVNRYSNDWNHKQVSKGVNAFIGKLASGAVATVQTLPWVYAPWGCGKGSKGSLNNTHIQFEICEDDLKSEAYFNAVYKEACELTAYLCKEYNLDPLGTFTYKGVKVPVITTHKESHDLKLGSNHGDPMKWLKKYGKDMDDVREDVAALLGIVQIKEQDPIAAEFKLGEEVKLVGGAKYTSGKSIPSWVFKKTLYVRKIKGSSITVSTLQSGAVTGTVHAKDLVRVAAPVVETLELGDTVKLIAGATYATGKTIPSWVFKKTLYVRKINGEKITVSTLKTGAVTGTVLNKHLVKI